MKNAEGYGFVTHPRRSRRGLAKSLNDLDFTDEVALLSGSKERCPTTGEIPQRSSKRSWPILINIGKTEIMTQATCKDDLMLDGEQWRSQPYLSGGAKWRNLPEFSSFSPDFSLFFPDFLTLFPDCWHFFRCQGGRHRWWRY